MAYIWGTKFYFKKSIKDILCFLPLNIDHATSLEFRREAQGMHLEKKSSSPLQQAWDCLSLQFSFWAMWSNAVWQPSSEPGYVWIGKQVHYFIAVLSSTRAVLPLQGTSGNVQRHCCLSQLGMGGGGEKHYWHPTGRGQGCFQMPYDARDSPPQQRAIWPKMPTVPRLRNSALQYHRLEEI